jgi:hypothetical protein
VPGGIASTLPQPGLSRAFVDACSGSYRSVKVSFMIFGEMNISNSFLLSILAVLLNR